MDSIGHGFNCLREPTHRETSVRDGGAISLGGVGAGGGSTGAGGSSSGTTPGSWIGGGAASGGGSTNGRGIAARSSNRRAADPHSQVVNPVSGHSEAAHERGPSHVVLSHSVIARTDLGIQRARTAEAFKASSMCPRPAVG